MKTLLLFCLVILCGAFTADTVGPVHITVALILAILAGCYEIISRLIPTSNTWSIIGKVLEVLTWLSNLLDRKK